MHASKILTSSLKRFADKQANGKRDARCAAATNKWEVQVYDRIGPVESTWRALESRGCCGLFQTLDWYGKWYELTSRHRLADPVIVTATRQGTATPEVILPLCHVRRRGYSEIGFPRVVTDFAGPVVAPEVLEQKGEFRRLWPQLMRALPKCDVVHLRVISEWLGNFRNPLLELPGTLPFPSGLWGVSLQGAAAGELPSTINQKLLRKTNRRMRQMEEAHNRQFEWHEQPECVRSLFLQLVEFRKARSNKLGRNEILQDPKWLDFYFGMATGHHANIRPVITRITADGETIAVNLGFVHRGIFHDIIPGLAGEDWNRYAPGIQLILETMREARRRGITYYDLTIGDESYKASLGAERQPLFQIIFPRSIRGWLLYIPWRLKFMLTSRFGTHAEQGP